MKSMKAVDFNLWMTIIAMTKNRLNSDDVKQYIVVPQGNVLPEYPRDLAKFAKPSIIIQKVADDIASSAFGGFIGQALDEESGAYIDVFGKTHELQYQFDVFGDTNTQCSLMTSFVIDDMFTGVDIPIMDYVTSLVSPPQMGVARLHNDMDVIPMDSNNNSDYRTAIRFYMTVVQTIVPKQEFVDLSKWIKIAQIVTI